MSCAIRRGRCMLQTRSPWGAKHANTATLPMALLTAIVRKEAHLPQHTAAFAATQLLPVIRAATDRHLAATPGQQYSPHLCKELLVSVHFHPSPRAPQASMKDLGQQHADEPSTLYSNV